MILHPITAGFMPLYLFINYKQRFKLAYWTTRGYANSRTSQLADWSTRG